MAVPWRWGPAEWLEEPVPSVHRLESPPFGLLRKCVPVASVLVPVYMGSNIPFSEVLEVGSRY